LLLLFSIAIGSILYRHTIDDQRGRSVIDSRTRL
jgi:hypothetical protein